MYLKIYHIFTNFKFQISSLHKSFSFINFSVQIFHHCYKYPPGVFHKKKAFLKHFVIFAGKHLCWGLFLGKVAGLQACNHIKKRLQYRYFLVNIGKFTRTPILKSICEWLLLQFWKVFCKNIFEIIT